MTRFIKKIDKIILELDFKFHPNVIDYIYNLIKIFNLV